MPIMPTLFDTLDIPDFEGMSAAEAWDACNAWEDWGHDVAQSLSEEEWDYVVSTMRANYDRYYERYENDN